MDCPKIISKKFDKEYGSRKKIDKSVTKISSCQKNSETIMAAVAAVTMF